MRLVKLGLALGLGLVLVGSATAQRQPGGGGGGGFGGGGGGGLTAMLGQNKALQDELKVNKEQTDKLTESLTKVREDLKDDVAKLRDRNLAQDERDKITKKVAEANAKALATVLKPEQVKRLHQIENQQAGIGLFSKEDTQNTLKLTDSQKEEITAINKDLQKDLRELSGGAGAGAPAGGGRGGAGRGGAGGFGGLDPETQKKRTELQKAALADIQKLLNEKQKAGYKDLTGETFDLTLLARGLGGIGGFGGFGQPGQVLSANAQDQLKLTADQKKKVEELQKELDAKLDSLLTDEQKKQLKDMRQPVGGRPGGANPAGAPVRP